MNKEKGGNVRFIRKGGRIIPIHDRVGRASVEVAKGTVVAAAGGAASAALAYAPKIAEKASRKLWDSTLRHAATMKTMDANKLLNARAANILTIIKVAKGATRFAAVPLFAGAALGGFHYAKGVMKATDTTGKQKRASASSVTLGTAAALSVAATSFLRAAGVKPLSRAARQSLTLFKLRM